MGGVVYGARCPVVLTSRADNNETKFNSLLLAMVMWQRSTSTTDGKKGEAER
jgi:phosphotransacetylase